MSSLRRLALDTAALFAAAVLLAGALRLANPAELTWAGLPPGEDEITFAQATALAARRPVVWVDARAPEQFAQGRIAGAIALTAADWDAGLAALLERWTPDSVIVVYCDSAACDASRAIAARLRERGGLPAVHVLHDGWTTVPATARDVQPRTQN